jgi:uncharacterized protein YjbI with pentapeptide repeats
MIYKLINEPISKQPSAVMSFNEDGTVSSFVFDPANTDYANFKKEVLAGAELQDADGNVMTDASAYIASLP